MKEMYSLSICFGKKDHLNIMGPILLPYLECTDSLNNKEESICLL